MVTSESIVGNDEKTSSGSEVESLKGDLRRVRGDLEQIAGRLASKGEATAEDVGSKAMDYAKSSVKKTKEFVTERPVTSALIAVGVAALVGGLIWKLRK